MATTQFNSTLAKLRERIQTAITPVDAVKSASAPTVRSVPEKDPNEVNAPASTPDPDATPGARNEPKPFENSAETGSPSNTFAAPGNPGNLHQTPVNSAREDGNAREDAFNSPTTPLSKIAHIKERMQRAMSSGAVSTGPTAAAQPAEGGSDANAAVAQLFKIASSYDQMFDTILEAEGGAEFVQQALLKKAGVEAARQCLQEHAEHQEMLKMAYAAELQQAEYLAAQEQELEHYEAVKRASLENAWNALSPEEQAQQVKIASIHGAVLDDIDQTAADSQIPARLVKLAYLQGVEDSDAFAEAPAGEEPQIPGTESLAEAPLGPEELVAMIEELVTSGEWTEEEGQQALLALQQVEGAGAEEEAAQVKEAAARYVAEAVTFHNEYLASK